MDLIERQAAVRKLKRMATQAYIDKLNGSAETIINCCIDVIERQIPSAQPERISDPDRVYDELSKVYNMKDLSDEVYSIIGDLMLSLHEPERKKGKWKKIHWKAFRCSECNRINEYFTNFCPNCGADMRGDDHD